MMGAILAVFIMSFPETLYSRTEFNNLEDLSYWNKLAFTGKVLDRQLHMSDFLNNFKMLKYWTIVTPCIYYMTANTYGSILFVLTASTITRELYNFDTSQTGILLGVPLTLGCLIGESCTGWISTGMLGEMTATANRKRDSTCVISVCFSLPASLFTASV
jgi:hypothetical protein